MRIKKSVVTIAAVAALLIAGPVAAASADSWTTAAGGGTWQHGVEGGAAFSNYHHPTKTHTATACNSGLLDRCRQAVEVKGKWARASTTASWSGNVAYWDVL